MGMAKKKGRRECTMTIGKLSCLELKGNEVLILKNNVYNDLHQHSGSRFSFSAEFFQCQIELFQTQYPDKKSHLHQNELKSGSV